MSKIVGLKEVFKASHNFLWTIVAGFNRFQCCIFSLTQNRTCPLCLSVNYVVFVTELWKGVLITEMTSLESIHAPLPSWARHIWTRFPFETAYRTAMTQSDKLRMQKNGMNSYFQIQLFPLWKTDMSTALLNSSIVFVDLVCY